jgi:hypothetical protein
MQALSRIPRRWLALAALATAVLVVPTASAGSAAAIKGVGAGRTDLGFTKFELSAHAERDPTTPEFGFGQVKIEAPAGSATIDVRCVRAFVTPFTGRPSAVITGVVTRSTFPAPFLQVGETAIVEVADGGEPASAVPVDTFRISDFGALFVDAETGCLFRGGFDPPPNVTQGNIVVKL